MNLQDILRSISFWKLDQYSEELNINFSSEDKDTQQKFECDFVITFLNQDKYFCYCIVENPNPQDTYKDCSRVRKFLTREKIKTKVTAITVHGHFLYQGDSLHDALELVAKFYDKFKPSPNIIEKN